MNALLISVGDRLPNWMQEGVDDYMQRLPRHASLTIKTLPAAKRQKHLKAKDYQRAEGAQILKHVPKDAYVIAWEVTGLRLSTDRLCTEITALNNRGEKLVFLLGGPDGLSQACLDRANARWSLSDMTLPHGLAKVFVAEQWYRAWTLSTGHPYHK